MGPSLCRFTFLPTRRLYEGAVCAPTETLFANKHRSLHRSYRLSNRPYPQAVYLAMFVFARFLLVLLSGFLLQGEFGKYSMAVPCGCELHHNYYVVQFSLQDMKSCAQFLRDGIA